MNAPIEFKVVDLSASQAADFYKRMSEHIDREYLPAHSDPFRGEWKCLEDLNSKFILCALRQIGINILPTRYLLVSDQALALIEVPWEFRPSAKILAATNAFENNHSEIVRIVKAGLIAGGRYCTGPTSSLFELCNISELSESKE